MSTPRHPSDDSSNALLDTQLHARRLLNFSDGITESALSGKCIGCLPIPRHRVVESAQKYEFKVLLVPREGVELPLSSGMLRRSPPKPVLVSY